MQIKSFYMLYVHITRRFIFHIYLSLSNYWNFKRKFLCFCVLMNVVPKVEIKNCSITVNQKMYEWNYLPTLNKIKIAISSEISPSVYILVSFICEPNSQNFPTPLFCIKITSVLSFQLRITKYKRANLISISVHIDVFFFLITNF